MGDGSWNSGFERFPFPPPLVDLAQSPDAFYFYWTLLHTSFSLPDPAQFPPLRLADEGSVAALARYVATAKRLAASTILSAGEQATIRVVNGPAGQVESVETQFSPHDVTVGYSTIFRQLFANSEPASFSTVRNIIGRANHELADADTAGRQAVLQTWQAAHAELLNTPVKTIVMARHFGAAGPVAHRGFRTPRETIEIFNYGDLIHWGKHRDAHDDLSESEVDAALSRLEFLEAVAGLSHLYLGFYVLVDRVLTASRAA